MTPRTRANWPWLHPHLCLHSLSSPLVMGYLYSFGWGFGSLFLRRNLCFAALIQVSMSRMSINRRLPSLTKGDLPGPEHLPDRPDRAAQINGRFGDRVEPLGDDRHRRAWPLRLCGRSPCQHRENPTAKLDLFERAEGLPAALRLPRRIVRRLKIGPPPLLVSPELLGGHPQTAPKADRLQLPQVDHPVDRLGGDGEMDGHLTDPVIPLRGQRPLLPLNARCHLHSHAALVMSGDPPAGRNTRPKIFRSSNQGSGASLCLPAKEMVTLDHHSSSNLY